MRKKGLLAFLGILPFLTSCAGEIPFAYNLYEYGELDDSLFIKDERQGYYKAGENEKIGDFCSFDSVFRDKAKPNEINYQWHVNLSPTGERNMLVIPVDFKDYKASEKLPDNSLDHIREAFFGDDEHNQFYSVASFYEKSSYGRLHLKGKVTDWFTTNVRTYEELKTIKNASSCANRLREIRDEALTWYSKNYPDDPISNYEFEYGDGYRSVAIYFVYAAPTIDKNTQNYRSSMMWAFTVNNPNPTSWSSYDLTNLSKGKVDAHTYIHETGHLLGLKDYYDANGLLQEGNPYGGYFAPLGRMDMMDYSLGDHNSYSKMLLNWARPYVPNEKCEITLRPFSSSGDFILLKDKWNGSPFDEYVLLELYSPQYINYVDASYREEGSSLFAKTGIKAYHVDSRLFLTDKMGLVAPYQAGVEHINYQVDIGNTNSSTRGFNTDNVLIQLLDKSSKDGSLTPFYVAGTYEKEIKDSNGLTGLHIRDSLFYKGEGLKKEDIHFHDGGDMGFGFKVKELTSTYAKIVIE